MWALLEKLTGTQKAVCFGISLLTVIFFGVTDHLTGSEMSFSIFYLIPITLATFSCGRGMGLLVAAVSATTWFFADKTSGAHYSQPLIPYWNSGVRLGYFALHATVISLLTDKIRYEREHALRDPLTNAANWRLFSEYCQIEIDKNRRNNHPVTFVYMDLDNFKAINDTLGHDVGDSLLQVVARVIQTYLRPSDMLARVGGDEFTIILPGTSFDNASTILKRIQLVTASEIKTRNWPVTISMGAVTYNALASSLGPMLKRADEAMYEIKNSGKNAIRHLQWPPEYATPGADRSDGDEQHLV